jgi:pyruvate dehydrogenase E2 component (dihydrolipoamide acetyltransferase)
MPSLGADMEAGTLIAWLKQPGETVERGEIIAEIDTDKGIIEVECFLSGVIEKLIIQPGEKVPVGTVLAIIQQQGQEEGAPVSARSFPKEKESAATLPAKPISAPVVAQETKPQAESARLKISPAARKMAEELGVDPASVNGTGPGGRITREDIERAVTERKAVAAPAETPADKHARMRQAIAAAMTRSKREIPHYYLSTQIDLSRALQWLAEENQKRSVTERLLYGVLLIKAVALALREYPEFNAVWEREQVTMKPEIHVGVAISLRQGGLLAPALRHTDQQSLDELMKNLQDLVKRTRAGGLRSSELSDSTITITSLGEQGVETVFGIIYPPQVALVGFGKVVERPWVVDGQIVARQVITATLAADHRASDGHRGGLLLAAVDRLLQEPEKL